MANIGGNITGIIQTKKTQKDEAGNIVKNNAGEAVQTWVDAFTHVGWLDLQSGDSKYTNFKAKVEESTHVFLCDYHAGIYALAVSNKDGVVPNTRMLIKGMVYDVLFVDNPMEMNEQLEIYLRKVGAWNGC